MINIWPKELKDCDEVGSVVATKYKCVLWLNPLSGLELAKSDNYLTWSLIAVCRNWL